MEFRVLGAIEVVADDGRCLDLGGSRSRALLAALLLQPGSTLCRESLIDALWADPPATASHAVEVYVSRLRRAIGKGRIRSQGHAYRVEVGSDELDLTRFRALAHIGREALSAGDVETAADALAAGLALWRGQPLACLNGEPLAAEARSYLEEERVAALETHVDALLALGRHHELVPELRRLVSEHPSRERLWERLMLALYRCGRQVDALDVFADLRARLRDELGIEPACGLRELQRRILTHDPTLAAPSAPPVRVPVSAR